MRFDKRLPKTFLSTLLLFAVSLSLASRTALAADARLLISNAYIFSLVPGQEKPFTGYMLVASDGTITAIAAGTAPAATTAISTLDAHGKWIIPGFISAHSHLWQSAYRGLAQDQTLDGWIQALYVGHAPHADTDSFYWFTLDGALDHLRHGVTSAYNFNYADEMRPRVPSRTEMLNREQFRAEAESGIRFAHGYSIGAIGPGLSTAQAEAHVKAFIDWTRSQPNAANCLKVMLNGAGAWMPNSDQTFAEATIMRDLSIGNQQHYLEAASDEYEEQSKFRWFLDSKMLGPHLFFGHFIHTNSFIVTETVKAGSGMSWNPLSNGRLASGTADIPAYLKAGLHIGMGVDGEASADRADPFENMRAGLYAVRAKYESAAVLSPYDVLSMHTLGGAEVLGVSDKLGSLAPGKLADFLIIDPTSFGKVFDPYASLVFVGGVEDIDSVYVAGELKVSHGKILHQDVDKVRAEAVARAK